MFIGPGSGYAPATSAIGVPSGRLLSVDQETRLEAVIVATSPVEQGIASGLWTRPTVRQLILQEFGLRLPIRTVGDYLRRWGLTPQRPVRHASRQDPEEVRRWLEEEYPALATRHSSEQTQIGSRTSSRRCEHTA